MSKVSSGSLRLSGNAFQTDGLAAEKARQPNVFRRHRGRSVSVEQRIAGTEMPTWGGLSGTVERSHVVNDMPVLPACSAPGRRRRASAALRAAEETSRCRTSVCCWWRARQHSWLAVTCLWWLSVTLLIPRCSSQMRDVTNAWTSVAATSWLGVSVSNDRNKLPTAWATSIRRLIVSRESALQSSRRTSSIFGWNMCFKYLWNGTREN